MSDRLIELAARRERLVERSGALRAQLGRHVQALAPLDAAGKRIAHIGEFVRAHPALLAGAAVFVAVARPRFLLRWARRAFVGWRLFQSARALLFKSETSR